MPQQDCVLGGFVTRFGERYYEIRHVDRMAPFFISLVSVSDHWLFISSNGGLTAGRVSPQTALFPYASEDKIHDSASHTGSKTLLRVTIADRSDLWEPFNTFSQARFRISRHLYKNTLGNKLCFEEVNHDFNMTFRYSWSTSDRFGFVRTCQLENHSGHAVEVDMIDGLQNILPAGTPARLQATSSNLVDAYKWNELDEASGQGCFTLYSGITDRPQPLESLKATTVFGYGLANATVLLSSRQLENFYRGEAVQQETLTRGVRSAYLQNAAIRLAPNEMKQWHCVANIEQSHSQLVDLRHRLQQPSILAEEVAKSIEEGSEGLKRLMAGVDGLQMTAEENVTVHHYANVLFNSMRGGVFDEHYMVNTRDLMATIRHFNHEVYRTNKAFLDSLPQKTDIDELIAKVDLHGDLQLERLCREYLPITFGRRHGDPSRPWNQFAIRLKDNEGNPLLSYEGNWRDIFQNWEALTFGHPEFIESVIAKFVNASTIDGYNPYRITKEGIDWEVEDPEDPWSYIGYWGDHQIIYLLKLLELSNSFHPDRLTSLLYKPVFCYANVPYRIKPFESILQDAKNTVDYSHELAEQIEQRVEEMGADGKLLLDSGGNVYLVNLLEKLLVPLLGKLANLVVGSGIWLNTQRPEWNDANNAIVGQGSSMVTMYYLRRYLQFLKQLLRNISRPFELSTEISEWLHETCDAFQEIRGLVGNGSIGSKERFAALGKLGLAAGHYRESVYTRSCFSGKVSQELDEIKGLLDDALAIVDYSIHVNLRDDGLYHAYNLLSINRASIDVDHLYPMLEGQVAALSSGAIAADEAVSLLEALFTSDLYRQDQHSFMLYPDRQLPGFFDKNRIPPSRVSAIPLLQKMLTNGDERIVLMDGDGEYRFHSDLVNSEALEHSLESLSDDYGQDAVAAANQLHVLYQEVFNHQEFTGRSGGMFGFEGLGCIYWHMVAKLLLAVQESFYSAINDRPEESVCNRLGALYYQVRNGIGFNKSPAEYGAFPTDPYSHTPGHAGARQPGMTGQVKEEVITRFGELGLRVDGGIVRFQPGLLREREFLPDSGVFEFLDVDGVWQALTLPELSLGFTWCQVPIIYQLDDAAAPGLVLKWSDGSEEVISGLALSAEISREIFERTGKVAQLTARFGKNLLLGNNN